MEDLLVQNCLSSPFCTALHCPLTRMGVGLARKILCLCLSGSRGRLRW